MQLEKHIESLARVRCFYALHLIVSRGQHSFRIPLCSTYSPFLFPWRWRVKVLQGTRNMRWGMPKDCSGGEKWMHSQPWSDDDGQSGICIPYCFHVVGCYVTEGFLQLFDILVQFLVLPLVTKEFASGVWIDFDFSFSSRKYTICYCSSSYF